MVEREIEWINLNVGCSGFSIGPGAIQDSPLRLYANGSSREGFDIGIYGLGSSASLPRVFGLPIIELVLSKM